MTNELDNKPPQIIIYETDDKVARVSVRLHDETVWLTNLQLAHLFQVSKSTVSEHIKNIFDSGELMPDSVVRNFRTTAAAGKTYDMSFYNLDMIISLGYGRDVRDTRDMRDTRAPVESVRVSPVPSIVPLVPRPERLRS